MLLPLLRYLLGQRGTRAGATTLAVTFFAAFTGMLSYGLHREIRWGVALALAVGQVLGAAWGQRLTARMPALERLPLLWAVLVTLLGLVMSANALGLPHPGVLLNHRTPLPPLIRTGVGLYGAAFLLSVLVGVVSRVIALGGVLLVPAEIYALHFTPQAAQGTALLVLVLASLPSVLIHARRGDMEPQSATWVSVGGVFGALVGAFYAASVLPSAILGLTYGAVLTLIGLSLLWRRPITTSAE